VHRITCQGSERDDDTCQLNVQVHMLEALAKYTQALEAHAQRDPQQADQLALEQARASLRDQVRPHQTLSTRREGADAAICV
jgi:hypothetical protein